MQRQMHGIFLPRGNQSALVRMVKKFQKGKQLLLLRKSIECLVLKMRKDEPMRSLREGLDDVDVVEGQEEFVVDMIVSEGEGGDEVDV